jgi:hypothetical protein
MTDKELDIIQMIEKNPITRLSSEYQNKLINKIKTNFNNKQQQLFVTSFYCYLNYNSNNEFVINFNDIWKWLGYSRKDPAKRLLENTFTKNIDYKILLHQSVEQKKDIRGGHNKENIMLTINAFKKFCLKSDTKKADEIHEYYIKLEDILHETIDQETTELKNQLTLKNKEIEKNKIQEKINKHNLLMEKFKNKKCVYIGELEENKLIKIGSTKDILERYKMLKRVFNQDIIFLDIYECQDFRDVESSIFQDDIVKKNMYNKPIGEHLSHEVVYLSETFNYQQLLTIIKKYVTKIYSLTPEQMIEKEKIELERDKIELEKYKLNTQLLLNITNNNVYKEDVKNILNQYLPQILQNLKVDDKNIKLNDNDNNKILEKKETQNPDYNILCDTKVKGRKAKGRKIQKIDPDNLSKIIKVYDSMIYLLRSPENKGCQKNGIQTAIKKNTIYKNYRWNFVEDGEDPTISRAEPTVSIKNPSIINTIVELNESKTEILDTYHTKNHLAKKLKIGKLTMTNIIKNGKLYNDRYYIEYHKCPNELLNAYKKPINRIIRTHSKQIKQINPITKESIIFNTLSEISVKLGFASTTIQDAIETNTIWGGYMWEYVN